MRSITCGVNDDGDRHVALGHRRQLLHYPPEGQITACDGLSRPARGVAGKLRTK
jgi:hypothetical protein